MLLHAISSFIAENKHYCTVDLVVTYLHLKIKQKLELLWWTRVEQLRKHNLLILPIFMQQSMKARKSNERCIINLLTCAYTYARVSEREKARHTQYQWCHWGPMRAHGGTCRHPSSAPGLCAWRPTWSCSSITLSPCCALQREADTQRCCSWLCVLILIYHVCSEIACLSVSICKEQLGEWWGEKTLLLFTLQIRLENSRPWKMWCK